MACVLTFLFTLMFRLMPTFMPTLKKNGDDSYVRRNYRCIVWNEHTRTSPTVVPPKIPRGE